MSLVLNLAYCLLLAAAAPCLLWSAWRHGKYREGFGQKLLGRVPIRGGDRPCIWFHAVSVGEVNLLRTIIDRAEEEFPGWDLVISTTTKTGYELARSKYSEYTVFYCPLDFSWAVSEAFRRLRPDLLVLAELELWPNLIRTAKRTGCLVAICNGRLSERSFRGYRWLRPLVRRILRELDLVAAQNEEYASRFLSLGARAGRVHVTGSVKFDGAQLDRNNTITQRLRQLAGIAESDVVFLAGSTQYPEEIFAIRTFAALHQQYPQLRLVLAPRHVTRAIDIADLLIQSGFRWQRRTELDRGGADPLARILLIDTIGELGAWWGTADIGFVGGSFGNRGGQNMIEPAAYGVATSFGPNTHNFRDIVGTLVNQGAAVELQDPDELTYFVRRCLDDGNVAAALGQRARRVVQSQQGATDRTLSLLTSLFTSAGLPAQRPAA